MTGQNWRLVGVVVEGEAISVRGIDPWTNKWQLLDEPRIVVPDPSYPDQRHEMRIYAIRAPDGPVRFAAGEFSNLVWGFYVPE